MHTLNGSEVLFLLGWGSRGVDSEPDLKVSLNDERVANQMQSTVQQEN